MNVYFISKKKGMSVLKVPLTIITGILIVYVSSCGPDHIDPGEKYEYIVDNFSDYELNAYVSHKSVHSDYYDTTILIPKNNSVTILEDGGIGTGGDRGDLFLAIIETLILQPQSDTLQITKDIYDRNNWTYSDKQKSNYFIECFYHFELDNSDLSYTE
jgi:hypothetical protein